MNEFPVVLISIVRALVEVALLSLLGQGALAVLAGSRRAENPVYRLFEIVVRPAIVLARLLLPRRFAERRLAVWAFCLMLTLWLSLAYLKRWLIG